MIFRSIKLKEGINERVIDFSAGVNLIHSSENSCGKTTLLRFMLYILGYNIPSTKRIKFDSCEVEAYVDSERLGNVFLSRSCKEYMEVIIGHSKKTFVLPGQLNEFHGLLYGTQNADILDNILGSFYVDQEKGWTLLNRGVVIGSIHFQIEELVRGLADKDCSALLLEEARLSRDIKRYRQMFSIAQYRESIESEMGSVLGDEYTEELNAELNKGVLQQKSLKSELKRIDRTLTDNKRFKKFIADMKLLIQGPNDEVIQVTEDNIVGLNDAIELLVAKRKMVALELAYVEKRLSDIRREQKQEGEQISFLTSESIEEVFNKRILSVPMNPIAIKKELERLEKRVKEVRKSIASVTRSNNTVLVSLYNTVLKYATELRVVGEDEKALTANYLFTSNLKELSGAILHKTVFAFRLAYILEIENKLKIKLPIILDSPSGKEVDRENIKMMVDILKRDFSDHQIIVASIFEYGFNEISRIEIVNNLIR